MTLSATGLIVVALVMAAWMGVAVWVLLTGSAMRRTATGATRQLKRITRLLEGAPALPLLVRADGRLEGPERLAKWMGRAKLPGFLHELAGGDTGISEADLEELSRAIKTTQRSGQPFQTAVRIKGTDTTLRVEGCLADPQTVAAGAALLWIFDATDSEHRIRSLVDEAGEARRAFSALSGLIEAAPMPMWFRGPDLALLLVNTAYVRAVGGTDADQVVQDQVELVEPVDGVPATALAARAQEQGKPHKRAVMTTVAGTRRAMEIVDLPLGEQGIAGYAIDIQDLQGARQEIARFRDSQRDLLDNLSAGVAQFDADRGLIFCNQPFQRLFALKPQWVQIGQEFDRVLDRMRETNHIPEVRDFPEWRDERRGWFRLAQAHQENWLLPNGTHLRTIAQPTPDNGLLLIFEDRTEQVQLASARDTLLRARTATFNNLYEALAVFSSDGRLNLWNSRFGEIWDVDEETLAEHPRADELLKVLAPRLRRPAQISSLREVIRAATLDRQQRAGQIEMKTGTIHNFVGIPLPDGNALFTMIDVTDSKRMELALRERNEALVEADAIKTRFLANMSYEFRTPLTSIGGFAELLDSGIAGDLSDQAKDYVKAILTSVERLSNQIGNVLDLSQSEAGTLPLQFKPVAVSAMAKELIAQMQPLAADRKISLELQIPSDPGEIEADPSRLRQALAAVLDNALRYTQEGGRVLFHIDRNRKKARFIVSDNGPGLDAKAQAMALDGVLHHGGKGGKTGRRSGLGLPLARRLVEAHGGRLDLVSEPDQGTMVTVEIG